MFSSRPKESAPSPAAANTAALKRGNGRPGAVPSIVSAELTVNGSLNTTGDMQVDGIVEGDIRSARLVIGEQAHVHGEIRADDVTVRGRVTGRIHARNVLLCATAQVEGDILHQTFAVEAGAIFQGNCSRTGNASDGAEDVAGPAMHGAAMAASMAAG